MRTFAFIVAVTLLLGCAAAYLAAPIIAAHTLREAVRSGDTRTIERMIVWPTFRASVRQTIAQNANLLPLATDAARALRPTLWQRVRSVFGHTMLDRFMERYITPSGLPELYQAKTRWHATHLSRNQRPIQPPEATRKSQSVTTANVAGLVPQTVVSAWQRVKRAEFTSPFRFILETEDPHTSARLIASTFQLTRAGVLGFEWKLTAISIRTLNATPAHFAGLEKLRPVR